LSVEELRTDETYHTFINVEKARAMRFSNKLFAVLIGLAAVISSCQKENLPSPSDCPTPNQGANMRIGDPSENNGDGTITGADPVNSADSVIVSGGDDDRDGGGGIVGGGDDDRDGGRRANTGGQPR
jgi:hypothetical protein